MSDELIPGRRRARARVIAAGLSDEDIDRLIEEARTEAQPLRKNEGGNRYEHTHQRGAKGQLATGAIGFADLLVLDPLRGIPIINAAIFLQRAWR